MKYRKYFLKFTNIGFGLSAALLVALVEHVSSANGQGVATTISPPMVVVPSPVVQNNYVYYPRYGIYYNSGRPQYVSLQGGAWVWAPAPGGVSVDALRASPSVNLDFHDSPANHLAATLRMYPGNWKPSSAQQDRKENANMASPDDNKKMLGQPDILIFTNTISTEALANRSGSSIANTNAVSTTATMPAKSAPDPPTNLRMISGQ